jgi:hypothetical protein
MLEEALRSEDPYQRKAGFLVLAVLSDGAGDHIRQRYYIPFLSQGEQSHMERVDVHPLAVLLPLFQCN